MFFETASLTKLELTSLTRLATQEAPVSTSQGLGLHVHSTTSSFIGCGAHVSSWESKSDLMLLCQVLYQINKYFYRLDCILPKSVCENCSWEFRM